MNAQEILNFWFHELDSKQWFQSSEQLDNEIKQRFSKVWQAAAQGELAHWRTSSQGRLAEIIVLDQFSRNIFRNQKQAFAQDGMALVLAQTAIEQAEFEQLNEWERQFTLLPFMHSESRVIHEQAANLFLKFTPKMVYEFELKHKNIIDKFGRYPHRNEILGRESTDEEREFLTQPDSSF